MDISKVKALTFDTGGTILDWYSGFKSGFEEVANKNSLSLNVNELSKEFRKKSLGIITQQDHNNLINFDEAHKKAVEEICKEESIIINQSDKEYLYYQTPANLNVWPDFLEPFNLLKKRFLCVSFTLLSNRLVFLNSKNNAINWDLILSCETLEVYKPNLEAYKKTAKLLQLDPNQCAMVACHSFDLNAAQKAGFKTIFVKRDKEWGPDTDVSVDGDYDMVVSDFSELTALVNN